MIIKEDKLSKIKLIILLLFPVFIFAQSNKKLRYDTDGMLVINGKRTFIIGSYHLPKSEKPFKVLSENGYNLVHVAPSKSQLNNASKNNLWTWISTGVTNQNNTSKKIENIINNFKNHTSLLNWEIADEPAWTWNSDEPRITPEKMKATYNLIKSIDPNHFVYTNHAPVNLISTLQKYNSSTDIVACDIYPVIPHGIKPTYAIFEDGFQGDLLNTYISQVGEYVDKMKKVANYSKPVFIVLQGFAWEMLKPENERDISKVLYPTYSESRFMAYNAIVHGANGILYWGTNHAPQPSKFIDDLNNVTKELNEFKNIISSTNYVMDIKKEYHELGHSIDRGIEIISKKVNDHIYLITTNSDKNPVKISFLGLGAYKNAKVLKENRIIKISENKMTDYYKPFDVHIYELN